MDSGTITSAYYRSDSVAEPSKSQPAVTSAFQELADAAGEMARASEAFLIGRDALANARARFEKCRDIVAKETEAIGLP